MNDIYPLTIIADRYSGVYSGGLYTAWNLAPEDIPMEAQSNDMACAEFWEETKLLVGKGNTASRAERDLVRQLSAKSKRDEVVNHEPEKKGKYLRLSDGENHYKIYTESDYDKHELEG